MSRLKQANERRASACSLIDNASLSALLHDRESPMDRGLDPTASPLPLAEVSATAGMVMTGQRRLPEHTFRDRPSSTSRYSRSPMGPHDDEIGRFTLGLIDDGLDDVSGRRNHADFMMLVVDGLRDEITKCVLRRGQDAHIQAGFDLGGKGKSALDMQDGDHGFVLSGDPQRMKERASRSVGEINRTEYSMKGTSCRRRSQRTRQGNWKSQAGCLRKLGVPGRFRPAEDFEMKDGIQDETW